jgi:hypothetical protein
VIRHPTIKAVINQCIGDVDSSSEDLVKMSPILMGDGARIESASEVEEVELGVHMVDVVVEVTTHHDCSIRILPQDILDDIRHSLHSLLLVHLLSWFEVAV